MLARLFAGVIWLSLLERHGVLTFCPHLEYVECHGYERVIAKQPDQIDYDSPTEILHGGGISDFRHPRILIQLLRKFVNQRDLHEVEPGPTTPSHVFQRLSRKASVDGDRIVDVPLGLRAPP